MVLLRVFGQHEVIILSMEEEGRSRGDSLEARSNLEIIDLHAGFFKHEFLDLRDKEASEEL